MKSVFLLVGFLFLSVASFAQYGRLQRLSTSDTTLVLRTPEETISKLKEQGDKKTRRVGNCIESVERQLDFVRSGFTTNQLPTMNVQSFLNCIKYLEANGIDVNYYVQEYFYYFPQRGSKENRTNRAY
ncbi:hypothetical protein [Pedobacter sp. SYSU D00535]|uniref:hypothetical protein n=1 Tax=Pedobacter sp. SYSU D00535 TaxID=2810308 RepID=UPI001A95EE91|nr:hypothetical protein [Pedobacter sp. SYSU D00535]